MDDSDNEGVGAVPSDDDVVVTDAAGGLVGRPGSSRRRGARVTFDAVRVVPEAPESVWFRLLDWEAHSQWVPFTRVDVDPDDPARFVAWSGVGPCVLEDTMWMQSARFEAGVGRCHVAKLGPVLVGDAWFTVGPSAAPNSSVVHWYEDVTVPWLPKMFATPVGWVAGRLFTWSLGRLVRPR